MLVSCYITLLFASNPLKWSNLNPNNTAVLALHCNHGSRLGGGIVRSGIGRNAASSGCSCMVLNIHPHALSWTRADGVTFGYSSSPTDPLAVGAAGHCRMCGTMGRALVRRRRSSPSSPRSVVSSLTATCDARGLSCRLRTVLTGASPPVTSA